MGRWIDCEKETEKCEACGVPKKGYWASTFGSYRQLLCDECFKKQSISLTFTHGGQNRSARLLPSQTATDALDEQGSSLVAADYNRSGGPDYELVLERTNQVLLTDKTLNESDVKDGDVLIVKQKTQG